MSGPRPLTRQRSRWEPVGRVPIIGGHEAFAYCRAVSDGRLRALVGAEPFGWHLSISFVDHRDRPSRYPRWDEILHARSELLPADVGFVMHLPTDAEYVAVHDTTFHLHEYPARES